MILSDTILKNVITNPEYSSKVLSYLLPEYFDNHLDASIIISLNEFMTQYGELPSLDALQISIQKSNREISRKELKGKFRSLLELEDEKNLDWLMDSTEKFCRDAAIRNAILRAVDIVEGNDKDYSQEAIPDILQDALSVGFDKSIGHDYFEDAQVRYEHNTSETIKIPLDIDKIDRITKGGLKPKTLSIFYAGCVHPRTVIRVRIGMKEKDCYIEEVPVLLEHFKDVYVDSPDGWVRILEYVEKENSPEYLFYSDGNDKMTPRSLRVNGDHLFETTVGWLSAEELSRIDDGVHFLTRHGYIHGFVLDNTETEIPIVDIVVDHPNHRYYTDGISSHNTGVGKTHFMCAISANLIRSGRNVLYISMEMYEEAIGERIDANLLDLKLGDVYSDENRFIKRIEHMKERTRGCLIIKEYPTCSASAADFGRLIDELKVKKGFIPDVVCVDYMSICKSSRYKVAGTNSYTYVKGISEELRALASKYNIAVITGAQVNRGGFASDSIELTDAAESFGGNFVADLVLGLNVDNSGGDNDMMIINQLKNRYASIDENSRFRVRIDRSKMRILNEEEYEEFKEQQVKERDRKTRTKFLKK